MISGIHHLGIAVKSVDAALALFQGVLGGQLGTYRAETEQWLSQFVNLGDLRLELMEPRGQGGIIERFLVGRGEGVHHFALKVDRVADLVAACEEAGLMVVNKRFQGPCMIGAFIHPRSAFGVLVELTEGVRGIDLP
ncbi:MAG: VOC family protein [Chloroflexi bacterium]|nr:VOC family protein [Chloroflexota bacterium]